MPPAGAPPPRYDPTRSVVHLGASHAGAWLELKSSVDSGGWRRVCAAPCDRSLVVEGSLARVTAPGMTPSNGFRIEPGPGIALVRVDGGSASARSWGIWGLAVSIPTVIAGGTLYSYGRFAEQGGMRTAGIAVLGTGTLALLISLPLLFSGSTKVRDGRGSVIAKGPLPGPLSF